MIHRLRALRRLILPLAVCLSGVAATAAPVDGPTTPPVTAGRAANPRHAGDPLAVRGLNPNFETFPDSSLVDFSFLLDAPAGKHGWVLLGEDGRFHLEKTGERIRFWGMTVAADHVGQIEKARISTVVDVLARGGCNLLRLHETDNRGGEKYNLVRRSIIDEAYPNHNKSTEFDTEYRDRVDHWIAEAQKRGMYVYLVLRAHRTFREGDGVPNADKMDRAAKPYAFFDERLIELQKQYADDWLFNRVNPYTGIPNGLNPAVCMLEIENEDSLLYGHVMWRNFVEPYRTNFMRMWNTWLKDTYGDTAALRKAWTNDAGVCALRDGESVEDGTVELPGMDITSLEKMRQIPWDDPVNSPARNNDGVRFARDVQRRYFVTMRDHLVARGARMPQSAVVHGGVLPDILTAAQELGTTAENAYVDHPSFVPGAQWVGKSHFENSNLLKSTAMAEHMTRYKWANTGFVCREWTNCWPNEYRAASFPLMAAHSAMQDYDMIIHFAYYTWGNPDLLLAFGPQADPTRWGLNGYAAALFLTGTLKPEQKVVRIAYNDHDLNDWAVYYRPMQKVAAYGRTELWNPDAPELLRGKADNDNVLLTVVSGRSGLGAYKGDNLVLFDSRFAEHAKLPAKRRAQTVIAASGYDHDWVFAEGGMSADAITKAGFKPFRANEDGPIVGFFDAARSNVVLGAVTEEEAAMIAVRHAASLRQTGDDSRLPDADQMTAAGGALRRDLRNGILRIETPLVASVAGELVPGETYTAGVLDVSTSSPIASVMAVSLDGKPLAESERFAVKMATVARNRGQELRPVTQGQAGAGKFVLAYEGLAPVQTLGAPSDTPTVVTIGGREVVRAFLVNGTWEVVVDRTRGIVDVMCDTPNVRFAVDGSPFGDTADSVPITKFFTEHPPEDSGQKGREFVYPGFAKYVRLGGN